VAQKPRTLHSDATDLLKCIALSWICKTQCITTSNFI